MSADTPSFLATIREDLKANKRNPKGVLIVLLYRVAHSFVAAPWFLKPIAMIVVGLYKFLTEYIIGTEIHWRSTIGPGLAVWHGYGLVVHSHARLGSRVTLRHGVTIGAKSRTIIEAPVIGNDVDVGSSALIIGGVTVGDGAVIGAGAVVTKDVPAFGLVAGNPATLLRIIGD